MTFDIELAFSKGLGLGTSPPYKFESGSESARNNSIFGHFLRSEVLTHLFAMHPRERVHCEQMG